MRGIVTEDQWASLLNAAAESEALRNKARALVDTMAKAVEEDSRYAEVGLDVKPDGYGGADFSSHVATGRLRFVHCLLDERLAARLIVERRRLNERDELVWQAVWAILIPQRGDPLLAGGLGKPIEMRSTSRDKREASAYIAAMSVLYALLAGPDPALGDFK